MKLNELRKLIREEIQNEIAQVKITDKQIQDEIKNFENITGKKIPSNLSIEDIRKFINLGQQVKEGFTAGGEVITNLDVIIAGAIAAGIFAVAGIATYGPDVMKYIASKRSSSKPSTTEPPTKK